MGVVDMSSEELETGGAKSRLTRRLEERHAVIEQPEDVSELLDSR